MEVAESLQKEVDALKVREQAAQDSCNELAAAVTVAQEAHGKAQAAVAALKEQLDRQVAACP